MVSTVSGPGVQITTSATARNDHSGILNYQRQANVA